MLPFLIIDLRFSFLIWILRKRINAKFLQINCLIKILFPEAVFDHMNVSIFNASPFEVSKAIKAFIDKDKTAIKNNVYAFRIWQVFVNTKRNNWYLLSACHLVNSFAYIIYFSQDCFKVNVNISGFTWGETNNQRGYIKFPKSYSQKDQNSNLELF